MPRNVQKIGARFRALVRVSGHKPVCRTFATEAEAVAFVRKTETRIRKGKPAAATAMTVAEAVEKFREFRARGARPIAPAATEHFYLNHLADPDHLGVIEIDRLEVRHLVRWCEERAEQGAGPSTMKSELSKLGTVLKHVAALTNTPPVGIVDVARPVLEYAGLVGDSNWRERRPSAEELDRLKLAAEPMLWEIIEFAIASAMRRSEITRIEWADVDEARKCIYLRDRKHPKKQTGHNMLVPLTSYSGIDAWAVLQRQARAGARVFPVTNEWLSDAFRQACLAAKVDDLRFHDLRHEATSRFFEAGLQIQQVAVLTGHRNWSNLRRYTQIRPETLHAPGIDPGTPQRLDSLRI